jgi:hypothetical protein
VSDLVEDVLDLPPIYASYEEVRGYLPYDPRLMVKLLVYGHAWPSPWLASTSAIVERRAVAAAWQQLTPRTSWGNQSFYRRGRTERSIRSSLTPPLPRLKQSPLGVLSQRAHAADDQPLAVERRFGDLRLTIAGVVRQRLPRVLDGPGRLLCRLPDMSWAKARQRRLRDPRSLPARLAIGP